MIVEAIYYSVKCDDCEVCTGDISDHSAWSEPEQTEDDWIDAGCWADDDGWPATTAWHLCPTHAPRCECGAWQESSDQTAPWCEDCAESGGES